jgi:hypothetical protein
MFVEESTSVDSNITTILLLERFSGMVRRPLTKSNHRCMGALSHNRVFAHTVNMVDIEKTFSERRVPTRREEKASVLIDTVSSIEQNLHVATHPSEHERQREI